MQSLYSWRPELPVWPIPEPVFHLKPLSSRSLRRLLKSADACEQSLREIGQLPADQAFYRAFSIYRLYWLSDALGGKHGIPTREELSNAIFPIQSDYYLRKEVVLQACRETDRILHGVLVETPIAVPDAGSILIQWLSGDVDRYLDFLRKSYAFHVQALFDFKG